MTFQVIKDADREYHYWRGFRSALLLTVPIIVILLVACNVAISSFVK